MSIRASEIVDVADTCSAANFDQSITDLLTYVGCVVASELALPPVLTLAENYMRAGNAVELLVGRAGHDGAPECSQRVFESSWASGASTLASMPHA
jgi:hypothetical protein